MAVLRSAGARPQTKQLVKMNKNEITIRERAAAVLYVYGVETSPAKLYAVAHPGSLETVEGLADIRAGASRWIRSRKIQEFIQRERAALDARQAQERKRIESDVLARVQAEKDDSITGEGEIDFSDPANQLRKLNSLINCSKDAGEALDALKVMIAKQQELAPEKQRKEKTVKFYRPLDCRDDCPLYRLADEILRLRSAQHYNQATTEMQSQIDAKIRAAGPEIVQRYFEMLLGGNPRKED